MRLTLQSGDLDVAVQRQGGRTDAGVPYIRAGGMCGSCAYLAARAIAAACVGAHLSSRSSG